MSGPAGKEKEKPVPPESGRVVLLLAMIAVAGLWLQHHLGFEFGMLGLVTGAGAIWAFASKLAEVAGNKPNVEKWLDVVVKASLLRLLRRASERRVLRVLGTLLVILLATVSSVTVRNETPGESAVIAIAPLDGNGSSAKTLSARSKDVRFRLFTNPFGRSFQLKAAGYLPAVLTVYPLTGKEVVLGRDLTPSPSVLFRPYVEGLVALRDNAIFRVTRIRGGRREVLVQDSGHTASFLVGPSRPITEAMARIWGLELDSRDANPVGRADLLLHWHLPQSLPLELASQDCILAEIVSRAGVTARAQVTIGRTPLMDVLMEDVQEDKGAPPC